ncbi:MAG: ABC transporter permease subunit [Acidobacteriota bacterium]|nr:MAG: ABC transporter permease subunit [Acidobacteriota bacterium]
MSRIAAIALATLSEAIRHRILYLLLIFALVLIIFSRVLSLLTVGEDVKIVKDIGLTAINLFGLMIALFVGVGILFREMERRTVQTTLATPVARWEYVLGKFSGLAAAITVNTALMAVTLFGLLVWREAFSPSMIVAVYSLWIELVFITAAAVFFASFSTPIFTALFTAATWVVGHLAWSLLLLEERLPEGIARGLVRAVYLMLPDLEYGDVRSLAVHGLPIPFERVALASVYELGYAALLLMVACLAFRRRDLV